MQTIKQNKSISANNNLLLQKNRWDASELNLDPNTVHSTYYFDFNKIKPFWLNQVIKKFILLQSATKSFSTCKSYLASLNRLMNYLEIEKIELQPDGFSRKIILGFLYYLASKKFSLATRQTTLYNIKTFYQTTIMEEWLPFTAKPIILDTDFPKNNIIFPRYVPDYVMQQLNDNLHHLPDYMRRFITILIETGRRISEICAIPFDSLEQDNQDDWFLRVNEYKMKKTRLIPVSSICVTAVFEQQKYLKEAKIVQHYLFPNRNNSKHKTLHLSARIVSHTLAKISAAYNIKDINGNLWHFTPHQFRHTLGTKMINTGVPQIMVQEYLGHESSEMTARYAHIHNETMKAAFIEYQGKLVNIKGESKDFSKMNSGQWLKTNITSQSLPNGLCTLPLTQQRCPHANACLTCANFRTSSNYLPQHRQQLKTTCVIIEEANKNGWQRVVEANTEVAKNLKVIICNLEGDK